MAAIMLDNPPSARDGDVIFHKAEELAMETSELVVYQVEPNLNSLKTF